MQQHIYRWVSSSWIGSPFFNHSITGYGSPWTLQGSSTDVPTWATRGYGEIRKAGGLGPTALTLSSPLPSALPNILWAVQVYNPESDVETFSSVTSETSILSY